MGLISRIGSIKADNLARKKYDDWDSWRRNLGQEGRRQELIRIATPMVGKLAIVTNFRDYYQPQGAEKHLEDLAEALTANMQASAVLVEPFSIHPTSSVELAKKIMSKGLKAEALLDYSPRPQDRGIQGELYRQIPARSHEKSDRNVRNPADPSVMVAVNRFDFFKYQEKMHGLQTSSPDLGYIAIASSQLFLDDENAGGFEYTEMQGGHAIVLADIDQKSGRFSWHKVA